MALRNIKNRLTILFEKYSTLGADAHTDKNELKKIKLFNIFTLVWYFIAIPLILRRVFSEKIAYPTITTHLIICFLLIIAQILHKNKLYTVGRTIYIFCVLLITFYFSNFVYQGNYSELYYMIAPAVCLVFIDNKFINFIVLAVSILLFAIPNYFFNIYEKEAYNDFTNYALFLIFYIIVSYFKNLNIKNERALEVKTDELAKINEFQSQFFVNISHEIRTPLTLIKGQVDNLTPFIAQNQEIHLIKEGLNKQVSKITKMVDDVLDLAKMESSNFSLQTKETNLTQLLTKIVMSFEPLFKQKGISFSLKKSMKNYYVKADALYLERAINNIILNAYKYTETGRVSLSLTKEKENVQLRVEDTGIGISKNDLHNICNRFYQVNNHINKAGGNGIGLAFSKEIIELHQGNLAITSSLGVGSSFKIKLPLLQSVTAKQLAAAAILPVKNKKVMPTVTQSKSTILIVDDHPEMRQYLTRILNIYHCIEVENGVEALAYLEENIVDFILTDYMMPKMNGLEFIKEIKNKNITLPILMLTAKTDTPSKLEILRLGIDDYLYKPFEKEELLLRIQNALANDKERINYIETQPLTEVELAASTSWIYKLREYVYNQCGVSNLNTLLISEHFNLSKSSLYRKIKAETGLAPKAFITEIKLQKARDIIEKKPQISLKQLALEVGFSHSFYFSKIYTERFGSKPL